MWKVSNESAEMLQRWLDEFNDQELKGELHWLMKDPMIFDYDKMMAVLKSLSAEFPVYQFIDRIVPCAPVIEKKVNPEYEARLERLKREQEDREYRKMTRAVDPNQIYESGNLLHGFGEEMKAMNKQLMVILNTVITVAGGFSFGYFGIGYAYPSLHLDIAFRMILGLVIASAVFFADLYFIIKGMDDWGKKFVKVKEVVAASKAGQRDIVKNMEKNK